MTGYSGDTGLRQARAKATLTAQSDGCHRLFLPLKPRLVKMRPAAGAGAALHFSPIVRKYDFDSREANLACLLRAEHIVSFV